MSINYLHTYVTRSLLIKHRSSPPMSINYIHTYVTRSLLIKHRSSPPRSMNYIHTYVTRSLLIEHRFDVSVHIGDPDLVIVITEDVLVRLNWLSRRIADYIFGHVSKFCDVCRSTGQPCDFANKLNAHGCLWWTHFHTQWLLCID